MAKLIAVVGCILVLVGLALMLPLADLLPVEFSGGTYLRVVPVEAETSNVLPVGLIVIGVVAVAFAWAVRRRSSSKRR